MRRRVVPIGGTAHFLVWRGPSGSYVGRCEELPIVIEGETWGEWIQACLESIQLLFEELWESGELEAFLRARGWVLQEAPLPLDQAPVQFDLPFEWKHATAGAA